MSNFQVCHFCETAAGFIYTDSRARTNNRWRRRECIKCGNRETTFEITADQMEIYKTAVKENKIFRAAFNRIEKELKNELDF